MITVVTGGSGSGKSEYAEELIVQGGKSGRYYIAAMKPFGEEGRKRILRHQRLRAGKGFLTIEKPEHIEEIRLPAEKENQAVLLECLSNLAANEFFNENGAVSPEKEEEAFWRIIRGIKSLCAQADQTVIVTNEIFSDGLSYEEETLRYIRFLGRLNQEIKNMADCVTEVVYGIPVILKEGGENDE